jgi:hypothetical protein
MSLSKLIASHNGDYFKTQIFHRESPSETRLYLLKDFQNSSFCLKLSSHPKPNWTIGARYSFSLDTEAKLTYSPSSGLSPSLSTSLSAGLQVSLSLGKNPRLFFICSAF